MKIFSLFALAILISGCVGTGSFYESGIEFEGELIHGNRHSGFHHISLGDAYMIELGRDPTVFNSSKGTLTSMTG